MTSFYENGGGRTQLAYTHVHTLILGMLFMLVIGSILHLKNKNFDDVKKPMIIYLVGISSSITMMVVRGSIQIFSKTAVSKGLDSALSGLAGLSHIILGIGLIYLLLVIRSFFDSKKE